jgi:hypothetical protein
MEIGILILLFVIVGVIGYLHFSSQKEEIETSSESLPPFNPNTEGLTPPVSQPTELDYIFLFAGNTIDRDGKHFQWNYELNKYEEINVSAGECIDVQNNETINTATTIIESQITDSVTQTPKPKKKRGRKPTKKVKK